MVNKLIWVIVVLLCSVPGFVLAVDVSAAPDVYSDTAIDRTQRSYTEPQKTIEQNAESFGVTTEEWVRYKNIMDGEGRYHWKNVDPRVVLGMYSKTASQRMRYAEMMARKEYELNKRFIDFNQAYMKAFEKLYGNEPVMNLSRIPAYKKQFGSFLIGNSGQSNRGMSIGDRIVLFISTDCSSCDDYYRQIRDVQGFSALDVYFINDSNEKITQWAKNMGIKPEQVKSGSVTLNADNGMYAKYGRPGLPASFYFNKRDQSVSAFLPE